MPRIVNWGSSGGRWLAGHWLHLANVAVLGAAIAVLALSQDATGAAGWANFAAGFAGVLALLWLVAGYRLQSTELSLQREELKLQRVALEQQATELSNSAKMASLSQIQALLEKAEAVVQNSELGVGGPQELVSLWLRNLTYWRDISRSRDPHVVQNTYNEWIKTETIVRLYLSYVVAAMKMYIEYHSPYSVDHEKETELFAYVYQSKVGKAPFLSNHAGIAGVLGQTVFAFGPGLKAAQLAGMTAAAILVGTKIFKDGALEEMRDSLLKDGRTLPAICDPWPDLTADASPRHFGQFPIPEHLKAEVD